MSEPKRYMDYGLETRRKNMENKMQEIAQLKKKGFSTKEISEELNLSVSTVSRLWKDYLLKCSDSIDRILNLPWERIEASYSYYNMISPILNVSKTDFERLSVLSNAIKNENA